MPSSVRLDDLQQKFAENPRRYFAPLANELRKAGDVPGAIALCEEHLAQQPGHMSGHVVLAQAHFDLGELDEAQHVFEHALQLDPDNVLALRYMGDIANQRGALDDARQWYERVLELDPRNPDAHLRLEHLVPVVDEPQPYVEYAGVASAHEDEQGAGPASLEMPNPPASDHDDPDAVLHELDAQFGAEEFTAGFFAEVLEPVEPGSQPDIDDEPTFSEAPSFGQSPSPSFGDESPFPDEPAGLDEPAHPDEPAFATDEPAPAPDEPDPAQGATEPPADIAAHPAAPMEEEPEHAGGPVAWQESLPEEASPTEDEPASSAPADADWFAETAEYPAPDAGAAPPLDEFASQAAAAMGYAPEEADEVVDSAETESDVPATADAFATATMAELYLRQGLNDQALDVYRQLVARHPEDAELRARVQRLEALLAGGAPASTDDGTEAVPMATVASPTVRSWLRSLASATGRTSTSTPARSATPPVAAAAHPEPGPSIEELLGRPVTPSDEHAAGALVAATLSLQEDPAVNAQLAELSQDDPASLEHVLRATPASVAALRQGVSFSFEQFFQKPADAPAAQEGGQGGARSSETAAPDGGTGGRDSIEADLEDFHAWLSGLSKS